MYILTVYFPDCSKDIYCDSFNETQEEIAELLATHNDILNFKIKY